MTLMTVLERTIAIMQDGRLRHKLVECPPDVMLCPKVGEVGLFDLRHLDDCIQAGMAEVHAHQAELVALRDQAARRPSWLERFRKRLMGSA
jgi:predicted acylesterase/phospholipase RssA